MLEIPDSQRYVQLICDSLRRIGDPSRKQEFLSSLREYGKSQACLVCQDPRYEAFLRKMKYRSAADERASTKSRAPVREGSSNHEN